MALPNTFANETAPVMTELDQNFAALGALTPIPCNVAGVNVLTFTPLNNTPTIPMYANYQTFTGIAEHTNTGAVTASVAALSFFPVYKDTSTGPLLLSGGEIVLGCSFTLLYDSALNSSLGGFHLYNSGSLVPPPAGTANVFASKAAAQAAVIDTGVSEIYLATYSSVPGSGAWWRRVSTPSPVQPWQFQTIPASGGDDAYWQLDASVPNCMMLGADPALSSAAELAGSTNTTAINNMMTYCSTLGIGVLECTGYAFHCVGPITIPTGIHARDLNIAGVNNNAASQNYVLVNSNVKLSNLTIVGIASGTSPGRDERGVYPATTGVCDVEIDARISYVTVCVQTTSTSVTDPPPDNTIPRRWKVTLWAENTVAKDNGNGGYGWLIAGGYDCSGTVFGYNCCRHNLYVTNGSRDCIFTVLSESTLNTGQGSVVVLSALPNDLDHTKDQLPNERIYINATIRGLGTDLTHARKCFGVDLSGYAQNCEIHLRMSSNTQDPAAAVDALGTHYATAGLVYLNGSGAAGLPDSAFHSVNTKLYVEGDGTFYGAYEVNGAGSGSGLIFSLNGDQTEIIDPVIKCTVAGPSPALITNDRNGLNTNTHVFDMRVVGGVLDCGAVGTTKGISILGNASPGTVGPVEVYGGIDFIGFNTGLRVVDATNQRTKQRCRSDIYVAAGADIPAAWVGIADNTTPAGVISLPRTYENPLVLPFVQSLSVPNGKVSVQFSSLVGTSLTLNACNNSGGAETVTGGALVSGD